MAGVLIAVMHQRRFLVRPSASQPHLQRIDDQRRLHTCVHRPAKPKKEEAASRTGDSITRSELSVKSLLPQIMTVLENDTATFAPLYAVHAETTQDIRFFLRGTYFLVQHRSRYGLASRHTGRFKGIDESKAPLVRILLVVKMAI